MPRFAKQVNCPASATLAALAAGTLPPLARQSAAMHLRSCDFCAAELSLHERADAGSANAHAPRAHAAVAADVESAAPPMPLALRLFAESCLAGAASASRRAA